MQLPDIDGLDDRVDWAKECMRDWLRDHPGEEPCVEPSDIAYSFVPEDPFQLLVLALRHSELMEGDPLEHIIGIRQPLRGYLYLIADNLHKHIEKELWDLCAEEQDWEEGEPS